MGNSREVQSAECEGGTMEGTVEVKDGCRRWSLSLIISTYAHGLVGQKPEKEDRFYALMGLTA